MVIGINKRIILILKSHKPLKFNKLRTKNRKYMFILNDYKMSVGKTMLPYYKYELARW